MKKPPKVRLYPRGNTWQIRYRDPEAPPGVRREKRISTGTSDRREAERQRDEVVGDTLDQSAQRFGERSSTSFKVAKEVQITDAGHPSVLYGWQSGFGDGEEHPFLMRGQQLVNGRRFAGHDVPFADA